MCAQHPKVLTATPMILLASALHGKHLTQETVLNQFLCDREGRVIAVPVSDCQKRSRTFAGF
jgi:hypothetical protein